MALQIANPVVVAKVERLAQATGMTKPAVVEQAIDRLAGEVQQQADPRRLQALFAQFDRIEPRPDAYDPLQWSPQGLPE